MRNLVLVAVMSAVLLSVHAAAQQPQQKAAEAARPPATFDPAALRKQAAQIAELRTMLADPDPGMRLLVMRQAIQSGDALQRQVAIESGLASAESALLGVALRGVFAGTKLLIIEFLDQDGTVSTKTEPVNFRLTVDQFDDDNGRMEGVFASCDRAPGWTGQITGTIFSFITRNGQCNGALVWNAETGDFRGRVNLDGGSVKGARVGIWRPR